MSINNSIRFSNTNMLPLFSSDNWSLVDASIVEGHIVINPRGYALVNPTQTILNLCFNYCRIEIAFEIDNMVPSNNFKSGPHIEICETYKDGNNNINQNINRCIGLKPDYLIDDWYDNTIEFQTANKPLGAYSFKIVNDSDSVLTIITAEVYSSIDISEDQVGNVVNDINKSTEPGSFKVYFTDGTYSMLSGLGALLANASKELKWKPIYANGLLGNIETNFGITYDIVNIPEPIDIDT